MDMMNINYNLMAVGLAAMLAIALLAVWLYYRKALQTLRLENDKLTRLQLEAGREVKKLRAYNARLQDDVRDRRRLMYWAARELNEHRDAVSLNAIIRKMVELTYYENLVEELPMEFVAVNQFCRNLVNEYRKKTQAGVRVDFKTDMNDVYTVHTNRECLEKVMRNLLENAVKHTADGSITIEAHDVVDSLELSVSDTGSGINKERQHAVFSLLKPVHDMKRRISTGLNISRTLVERLGGSLYIDPHYTNGTSVHFSIAV